MKAKLSKTNQVALVTGAAQRLGKGIALDLAKCGWTVVVHYNQSKKDASLVVDSIQDKGGIAIAFKANLLVEKEIYNLVAKAKKIFGPITCLINNASTFDHDTPTMPSLATWERNMKTNLRAPFLLSQELFRQMPPREKGSIINIIDQRVWNLTPEFTSYTISKYGLWGVTQILAKAFAPYIRVNSVGPGPILQSIHQSETDFQKELKGLPLKKPISIDEICDAIRFILSAPSMTGQMIALDGGQHMGWCTNKNYE